MYTSKVVKGQNFPQLLWDVRIVLPDFAFILMKILKLSQSFHEEEMQIFLRAEFFSRFECNGGEKGIK